MNKTIAITIAILVFAVPAFAGTATMNFASNVGLLTQHVSGPGELTASGGRAHFSNGNVTLLAQGGSTIYSGGTTTLSMTLQPSVDALGVVGLVMFNSDGDQLSALCDSDGMVTLMDANYFIQTLEFPYPAALNNSFTLTYNGYTDRATLTLNGTQSKFLEMALNGASSVSVGVGSDGIGGFSNFSATGSGIPDYPPVAVDTDSDGVNDDVESAAGTDPTDPGSLPVSNTQDTTIHARNNGALAGATVVIAAGSLPSSSVNVAVSTPASIPPGAVPGDKDLSDAGVELGPNGTNFSSPVSVTLPYSPSAVSNLVDSSLTVFYFNGSSYSASGIAGISLNTGAHTMSFTTTHFTTFVIAGDLRDSDGDGIDDDWEMHWFGNLTTADADSDFDGDAIPDVQEFRLSGLGLNPTQTDAGLPVGGAECVVLLGAALIGSARRKLR